MAFANKLPGKDNRWFLGFADEPTDVAVLLCRSSTGKLYDIVLPVSDLDDRWNMLSRSGREIKFNVRKEGAELLLLIPGNEPFRVTKYLANYKPLRRSAAV